MNKFNNFETNTIPKLKINYTDALKNYQDLINNQNIALEEACNIKITL